MLIKLFCRDAAYRCQVGSCGDISEQLVMLTLKELLLFLHLCLSNSVIINRRVSKTVWSSSPICPLHSWFQDVVDVLESQRYGSSCSECQTSPQSNEVTPCKWLRVIWVDRVHWVQLVLLLVSIVDSNFAFPVLGLDPGLPTSAEITPSLPRYFQ